VITPTLVTAQGVINLIRAALEGTSDIVPRILDMEEPLTVGVAARLAGTIRTVEEVINDQQKGIPQEVFTHQALAAQDRLARRHN